MNAIRDMLKKQKEEEERKKTEEQGLPVDKDKSEEMKKGLKDRNYWEKLKKNFGYSK